MPLQASTLRPGFLVVLKMSTRGNVHYVRTDLDGAGEPGTSEWKTKRTIDAPEEHAKAQKVRSKAGSLIRSACAQSAFGLLCPEVDSEKLEAAVADARALVDAFNAEAQLSRIGLYVLTGRVMPDDAAAIAAINSEIRDLMADMTSGVENGNVEAIRAAASRVKGIGEMLATDAQTKIEMAVKTARDAARQIVRDREMEGSGGTARVDKSAVKRINELRTAFLDLDESAEVAAPKSVPSAQLDLGA